MRRLWTLVGMGCGCWGPRPWCGRRERRRPLSRRASPVTAAGAARSAGAPAFPKLDGQHAAYLDKQLREYKSGKRKSAIMAPMIAALKKQQISGMAAHFASQTPGAGRGAESRAGGPRQGAVRGGQPRHRRAGVCRLSPAQWRGPRALSPPGRPALRPTSCSS